MQYKTKSEQQQQGRPWGVSICSKFNQVPTYQRSNLNYIAERGMDPVSIPSVTALRAATLQGRKEIAEQFFGEACMEGIWKARLLKK